MNLSEATSRPAVVVRQLRDEQRDTLEQLKKGSEVLERPDFIWHYLLQGVATMGRAAVWKGLIGNATNYNRVTYEPIANVAPDERRRHIEGVCRVAGVRMPSRKADFILRCFDRIQEMGGLAAAKSRLLSCSGREAKIAFLDDFRGIGPKYARNIMMDVHHPEFCESIAIDVRI